MSRARFHDSDCAIYNSPAYEPGPCDCRADGRTVSDNPMRLRPQKGLAMPAIHENTVSEYKVRSVVRYHVTRYRHHVDVRSARGAAGSESLGEFDNASQAYAVAYALANEEARNRDLPLGDERVMFPSGIDEQGIGAETADHLAHAATQSPI